MATIIVGELPRSFNPAVSEWGNPAEFILGHFYPKTLNLFQSIKTKEETTRTETSK